ncbi:hypothetical protein HG1285_09466 [Hydrogenivirga sp. 128-5-R1-1]|nr:hypothetical protein HG1285_09466 [Hydrogenivirga sp. 128-5-R1-1]
MIMEKEYTALIKEFLKEKSLKPFRIRVLKENDGFIMIIVKVANIQLNKAVDLSFEATRKLYKETGQDIAVSIIPT